MLSLKVGLQNKIKKGEVKTWWSIPTQLYLKPTLKTHPNSAWQVCGLVDTVTGLHLEILQAQNISVLSLLPWDWNSFTTPG